MPVALVDCFLVPGVVQSRLGPELTRATGVALCFLQQRSGPKGVRKIKRPSIRRRPV